MALEVNARLMAVVQALRHGITTISSPGFAVNTHPNPFFLNVQGEVDLKHLAEHVLTYIARFEAQDKKCGVQEADAVTAASVVDGR